MPSVSLTSLKILPLRGIVPSGNGGELLQEDEVVGVGM